MVCRQAGAAPRVNRLSRCEAALALGWALSLFACEPALEVSNWPVALRQVAACEVGVPSELELVALGDFPSRSYRVSADRGEPAIDDVPVELRELLVRATTPLGMAEGRRVRGASAAADREAVWLLQSGPSCPLADTGLGLSDGAAVAALPNGGALLVGGTETATLASSQALLLVEGQEFAVDVQGGMLLRRAGASATALADAVLVAGGTPDRRAGAHDTYELFDLQAARFDAARSGKLEEARMQHAALRLPDQRVLLIGGRKEPDGEPLVSIELVDVRAGTTELFKAGLQVPRLAPDAVLLDSGSVLVLAGSDAAGRAIGSVEVYHPEPPRFELAASGLPVHAQVCVAALPGARAAWLSCDHASSGGGAPCELALIHELDDALQVTPVALDFAQHTPNGLTDLRLIYAGGGRLLWTGADDSDPTGPRRAFVIDVAAQTLVRVDASRVPSQLLRLQNGLLAELDDAGLSVRAAFTRGRYASPVGDLLEDADANLVLDAAQHWVWQEGGAQALAPRARMDLGELRFAAFRANVRVQGDYTLRFYDGLGHNAALSVRGSTLELPGCRSQLQADMGVQLLRAGSRISIAGTSCSIEVASDALGIALVLEKSAVVRGITIQRM